MLAVLAWGALALWFQLPLPPWGRVLVMLAWLALGLRTLGLIIMRWCRQLRTHRNDHNRPVPIPAVWRSLCAWGTAWLLLLLWWASLAPSHQRDWADDVARLLSAERHGSQVTLHNVRNFQWRSETDYDVRWEIRQYDLDTLVSADLILSYWMGPHIAHTLVSFGFADGRQLVFSAEIRKERGEAFSSIGGFFKEFELVLIAADENDIVRTRTNARGEDVYLYRLNMPKTQLRPWFERFLDTAADIEARPHFYHSLTSNCTTIVFGLARQLDPGLPLDWRLLLSGHLARYAYDLGALAPGYRFEALQRAGRVTERALATDDPASPLADMPFSAAIRQGVPGIVRPDPMP
ncbi:DUF4105 domain-containing protein [Corticibacter populi]|uniref:DUF4105 domain-containing protein n=2 Tax=Corticibacter populi TaxID=1550736 RepID=A0A3M6R0V7_9BURK|nr:DUF4105 domain-containing protein [Corticibacter populi]RMX08890.1 DUF4105 domain-containing protein [Corticibacter populi]